MLNNSGLFGYEKPNDYCGVFGVFGSSSAAIDTFYGLYSLQHRGQESAGIVTLEPTQKGTVFHFHKDFGLVADIFSDERILTENLRGYAAIGHNRYSTSGSSTAKKNIQPFTVNYKFGHLAVAHNGNLTNADEIREELVEDGAIFQTTSDTEVILHLIARCKEAGDQTEQIRKALQKVKGAYSLLILTDDKLIAARDPYGFKPLSMGRINGGYAFASETCAFDINKIEYLREVEPGEMVVVDNGSLERGEIRSIKIFDENPKNAPKHCIFEFIYFSRPDSRIFGASVDKIRRKLGKVLAENHPVISRDGTQVIVVSVPDSSNTIALGYQKRLPESKLEIGLIRSHYVGRTFIQPAQRKREVGVRIKFNIVKGVLKDKIVVLIDDSIVRGTTSKQLVELIKEAEPREIHLRIASPPIFHPCFYGMDFPSKEELIANRFDSIEEIRKYLGVDSLEYLTPEEMLSAMTDYAPQDFCTACFTGEYPTEISTNFQKEKYDEE
jgi:amidophosphoribosyltransferase